jgi:mannosyltransferase OCH1-like enzyme
MAALRRKFKKAADPSVDAILAQPMSRLRMGLAVLNADKKMAFSEADFQTFVQKIYGATADPTYLNQEIKSVLKAMATGRAPDDPNITRPETQLLWAAALIFIMKNREALAPQWTAPDATAPITETALWNALTSTPRAIEELVQHAFYVTEATRNPTTKLRWGKPGSWFYFSPDENIINSDFLISLIGGFEHTRGYLFHEIGHSQLTVKFLPTMLKLKEKIDAIHEKKKAQNGKLSKEEFTAGAKDAAKAETAFAKKDNNGDGFLSLEEFTPKPKK